MFGPPDKPGLWKSAKALYAATYTVVRQTIGNTTGISSDASSLGGAVAASLSRYDEVNLKGDLIDKIKADPAMQIAEQSFVGQLESNEKLGKEDFTYGGILRVQFGGSRGDGQGSWEVGKTLDVALNSLTWLIRNTDVNASATVSKDGKVKITYSLSPNEKLDLRPNGSELSYDIITSVLGFLYHDIAGGSDQTKTRATWTTETELK
ncbi:MULTISPECIES: hypothetical protein [unclassified Dysgonomonas]|jgi:hypothetical protein|uniref:hypothetical protein n=1 Tax=unclassified Dysgonomonas TaxID=2630389 RepID=UPI0025BE7DC2|nr:MULTISPECIES: hypothetical protein [unclassified Dysgonomonas]HMM04725.1 hypothetical protein [Dysgonomonas sp.]